ncbi:hypothetical protein OC861_006095 [Tilletia horrida]|nr:hypothetical protein OC861_006095 [Tilletia horrida]
MKVASGILLALVSAASAATSGPNSVGIPPAGFEKVVLNTTILCNFTFVGVYRNQPVSLGVDAVLPNQVNSSQPFTGLARLRLFIPRAINQVYYAFGARSYDGVVQQLVVDAAGSIPSSVDAAQSQLISIPRTGVSGNQSYFNNSSADQISIFEFPAIGNAISIGPFTPSQADSRIPLSMDNIKFHLNFYNRTGGENKYLNTNVTCRSASSPALLAYVSSGSTGSVKTVTPSGGTGAIPQIPINSSAASSAYKYACSFTGLGSSPLTFSVAGAKTNSTAIPTGYAFSIRSVQGNVFSSSTLVTLIKSKYSTATDVSLKLSSLAFNAANASPSTQNGIPSGGLTLSRQSLTSTATFTFPSGAPSTTLAPITFTAGASGSPAYISLGAASGSITVYNGASTLANVTFSCPARSPAVPFFPVDVL